MNNFSFKNPLFTGEDTVVLFGRRINIHSKKIHLKNLIPIYMA